MVRLYLSSFRLGNRSGALRRLVTGGRRAGVIANALDGQDAGQRQGGVELELNALSTLGFGVEEVDLREHFDGHRLEARLRSLDLLWVRGGNVFVLRYALSRAGADVVLPKLLDEDALVYGGYSAGPCVLGPSIDMFARTDDPHEVERLYGHAPMSSGLGVLDFVVVPHVDSPAHPASPALTALADELETAGTSVLRLRDGEVLTVNGDTSSVA